MSYTKHNYKKGDELLASQLNDMDDQIAINEQTADTLVTVSNTQPAAAKNRVWVKATPSEIEIPTMEDHNELSRQLSDVEDNTLVKASSKNIYNPDNNMTNTRMYVNPVGSVQTYTTQSRMNVQKIVIDSPAYTMVNGTGYVITDENDIIIVAYTAFTTNVPITINNLPSNAYYLWIQANDAQVATVQVETGTKRTAYEQYSDYVGYSINNSLELSVKDIPVISRMSVSPFSPDMTKVEFATAHNNIISMLANTSLCAEQSFFVIRIPATNAESTLTWEYIFKTVNRNLREDVASVEKSIQKNCNDINNAINNRIYRFEDAKLNNGTARDFSLNTGFQADEPSVIVSDDGETLYVYAHLYRIETTDGVNWSEPISTPLSDGGYIMHNNVAYIDGLYYLIGARQNSGGDLVLYTSENGVDFTYRGIIFKNGKELASDTPVSAWGNSYLLYEYGSQLFYLYIETQSTGQSWVINLATCSDIFSTNQDGTIGNWISEVSNPVISTPFSEYTSDSNGAGNPDFARSSDNRPVRYNGKWFMYFHSTFQRKANILRASSSNLVDWSVDGIALDVRDVPTGGDLTSGNADASTIEYKGRTYMFYTWNINQGADGALPYIKYLIDDRPITELIRIRP